MAGNDGERRESRWEIVASLGQLISAIVGVAAVVFSGFALIQTREQGERQDEQAANIQTLTLFATFNNETMLRIRNAIDTEEWCARWYPADHERSLPVDPTRELTREQLTWFIEFFDAVHTCGDRNVCNTDLNQQLFRSYAATHYQPIARAIVNGRQRNENFGDGMTALAGVEGTPEEAAEAYAREYCSAPSETQ